MGNIGRLSAWRKSADQCLFRLKDLGRQLKLERKLTETISCCDVVVGKTLRLSVWRKSVHFVAKHCVRARKPWIET